MLALTCASMPGVALAAGASSGTSESTSFVVGNKDKPNTGGNTGSNTGGNAGNTGGSSSAKPSQSNQATQADDMYRLYNPYSGEHFYTASATERDHLASVGWNYEGVSWRAPRAGVNVYRLYNPNAGDHHYTLSSAERDMLVSVGWNYEGVGWKSDTQQRVPVWRQYNPYASCGSHNFTTSKAENDHLASIGWNAEGVAWYGC